MGKFFNGLATLILVCVFAVIALWSAFLIPLVLGCALAVFLLFWFVAWAVDLGHALWCRIRSPPARKRER